ncbi:methyltransferase, type 11 family [Clostridioides difficile]|nr:methyltransferase, type 11 family [Clostridioides difficile]VIE97733.1 methyltransferase, type 11 family [Clostridioides difficile]
MKQNKYDDDKFFNKYSKMERSINGLAGAGEWHTFRKMLPNFKGKRVLDLGCGFRVIIVIEANSYVNIRSSRLLPKFKTQKINSWCAA